MSKTTDILFVQRKETAFLTRPSSSGIDEAPDLLTDDAVFESVPGTDDPGRVGRACDINL